MMETRLMRKSRAEGQLVGQRAKPHEVQKGQTFVNDTLVLYRGASEIARLKAARLLIEEWTFASDGKQVVLKSRASQGPAAVELFDVVSGHLEGKLEAYEVNANHRHGSDRWLNDDVTPIAAWRSWGARAAQSKQLFRFC
jgi:hypothetical protein